MANGDWIVVTNLAQLHDDEPISATALDIDLVVVQSGGQVYALYGRCPHRGGLMSAGCIEGGSLVCTLHGWDFDLETGASGRVPGETLTRFGARIDQTTGDVLVSRDELEAWRVDNPQAFLPGEFF